MQQKCKIMEMSDTIRRNEHTKICMAKLTNLTNWNFVNFVKLVMQNLHEKSEKPCWLSVEHTKICMRKVRNLRILTFLTFLSAFSKKEPTFDVWVINEEISKRDNLSRFHFSRGTISPLPPKSFQLVTICYQLISS